MRYKLKIEISINSKFNEKLNIKECLKDLKEEFCRYEKTSTAYGESFKIKNIKLLSNDTTTKGDKK